MNSFNCENNNQQPHNFIILMNPYNGQAHSINHRINVHDYSYDVPNSGNYSASRIQNYPFYFSNSSFYPIFQSAIEQMQGQFLPQFFYQNSQQSFLNSIPISNYCPIDSQFIYQPPNVDYLNHHQKTPLPTQSQLDSDSKEDDKSNIKSEESEKSEKAVKQQQLKIEDISQPQCAEPKVHPYELPVPRNPLEHHLIMKSITRQQRVERYKQKKSQRTFDKRIVYQCRKSVADSRLRVKGRFVKNVQKYDKRTYLDQKISLLRTMAVE